LSLLPLYVVTNIIQIATSNEVDLGEDEEPEAIRAMIRHMYDLPYDQMLMGDTADDSAAYSTNEDLLFHIGVFTAADKYDVPSLRPLVVKKFESLMETNWEGEYFAASIQKLTGPSAGHLADNTLQAAAAAFCAKHLTRLVRKDTFVKMIHEEEPFVGRLLTGFLEGGEHSEGPDTIQLKTCLQPACNDPDLSVSGHFDTHCMVCGINDSGTYYDQRGQLRRGLFDRRKARLL
jgi:hypothetical protein